MLSSMKNSIGDSMSKIKEENEKLKKDLKEKNDALSKQEKNHSMLAVDHKLEV